MSGVGADGWGPTARTRQLVVLLGAVVVLAGCGVGAGEPGPESDPAPRPHPIPPPDTVPAHPPSPDLAELQEATWHLYRADGTSSSLDELLTAAAEVEVILVGERHGDPGGHRFQRELLDQVLREGGEGILRERRPVLSLEMFETDVQPVLDEYLSGLITEEHFLAAARPWRFYERDYRPLVEAAREAGIPVVAANAPRRYVNRVSRLGREGLDDLPPAALEHLPPLPFPEPSEAYRAEWEALMQGIDAHGEHGHGTPDESALEAQALWDAAMAHAVALALEDEGSEALVVHMAGSFHVENRTGIPEALRHYHPEVRDLLVVVKAVEDPSAPPARDELEGVADFIVFTLDPSPS